MTSPNCYRFESRLYNDGIFDPLAIDATYIIHLDGNGRLPQIDEELIENHPTNRLWILHNKGYRKCNKEGITSPALDLIACYYEVFRHAAAQSYKNILVLEDDFFFDPDFRRNMENLESITEFLLENQNTDFAYLLGCLPILQNPVGQNRRVISLGTHAVIYSQKCRDRVLLTDPKEIGDWDIWHNLQTKKYMFYQPVCYQLFPKTENQQGWLSSYLPKILQTVFYNWIILPFFNSLSLDTSVEPGYPIFYMGSYWASIGILVLLLYILYLFCLTIYMKM